MAERLESLDRIVNLAKRRGFVYQTSEIYGGLGSVYEYGPLGAELRRNIRESWWRRFVTGRPDVVGLEGSIFQATDAWRASGHLTEFTDPLVECRVCHLRFRADQEVPRTGEDGHAHDLTPPKAFNLLFATHMGPVADTASEVYLRGETAQSAFQQFKNVLGATRAKLPFGIALQGRSFRNEITTGNFIFRQREFEIMEIEYFVKPGEDETSWEEWTEEQERWLASLGIPEEKLRRYDHPKEKLSHYSKGTVDIEFEFPFGWGEITGNARRTDFDLANHQKLSGQNLEYFDEEGTESFLPWVVEPTFGLERIQLAVMVAAYDEEDLDGEKRVVMRFTPELAPVKVAVLPLSKKPELSELTGKIAGELRSRWNIQVDEAGSIGRRYRRQDEIGTPYCVTIDFDSLEDGKVTVRDRDTMQQGRVAIDELGEYLSAKLDA
jgi:glycyl-tRNA synthetase